MDITVARKDLLRLVGRCQGVADKKSAMPMLANALLAAESDSLRVSATDLYLSVSGSCDAEAAKPGTIAVPAKDLMERIKMMPDGPVRLTAKDCKLTLKAVGAARRYTLQGMPGEEFPKLAAPAGRAMELQTDAFLSLIDRTAFSISPDETRAHVNSALLELRSASCLMVTTDGHRLSKCEVGMPDSGPDDHCQLLLPKRAVDEIKRLLDTDSGTFTFSTEGPYAFFAVDGFQFACKLTDANFPPYAQVIPKTTANKLTAPRALLADALRAVSLASSDGTGGVKLTIEPDKLTVTAESPDSGNASDEVAVVSSGKGVIGVNARYVLDVLGCLECEEVEVGFGGELDPVVIRDGEYVAVVMPMRV
jgi:DNA polymerase-3 subunit beta